MEDLLMSKSTDEEANGKKIAELEDDLALRKAQLSDPRQKILTADQENEYQTQWDTIQSMLEAKMELKYLFELLVDTKNEIQNQSEKGFEARYEEIKEAHDRLALELENGTVMFECRLATVKLQSAKKLSDLVALRRAVIGKGSRLQNVIQHQQKQLDQLKEENKKLVDELEQLRSGSREMKSRAKEEASEELAKKEEYCEPATHEEEDEFKDIKKNSDWRKAPKFKSIQKKLVDELEQLRSGSREMKSRAKEEASEELAKKEEYCEPATHEEEDEFKDIKKNSDWRKAPKFKSIQARRSTMMAKFATRYDADVAGDGAGGAAGGAAGDGTTGAVRALARRFDGGHR